MRTSRFLSRSAWLVLAAGFAAGAHAADEQEGTAAQAASRKVAPQVFRAARAGRSLALRTLAPPTPPAGALEQTEVPNVDKMWDEGDGPVRESQVTPDGALQGFAVPDVMPAPGVSFEGLNRHTQSLVSLVSPLPPDTVGDVGPNRYVQCVNDACEVFDKLGNPRSPPPPNAATPGPFTIRSLYTAFGGSCETTSRGDPIVLYDLLADRWLISQLAHDEDAAGNPIPPFHECVAISQAGDPSGPYFLYDFVIPNSLSNDYPKFGVWPDGYYETAPLFGGPLFGQGAFVLNRAKMLVGDASAEMIFFDLARAFPGLQRVLPADLDGPAPPPGTPNYLATIAADEFGDAQDGVRIFEARPDFADPSASTFTEIAFPNGSLAVAAFDPTFTELASGACPGATDFTSRDDIPQPPSRSDPELDMCPRRLDAIADRPMQRLTYRNFGAHESLIFTHTVDVNATAASAAGGHLAGIRYYELRRTLPGGTWTVNEQATFSPDSVQRWMGSAAMDAQGNLAVGYSVSDDSAAFPGVRYAGRLAGDAPGGLLQGEATLVSGGDSQTTTLSRWGDYGAMSVDPSDDCTFWYTQEYYTNVRPPSCSSVACWQTRVGAFKFPSCTSTTQTGTLQGSVTDAGTALPISGALVQANGYSDTTDGSGNYSLTLPVGAYDATASKSGYGPSTASGLSIIGGGPTTQNFTLGTGTARTSRPRAGRAPARRRSSGT